MVFSLAEARRLREDALDVYRRRYDLLTADEIRALRRRLRLTQGELARLLRLGASTISRWEAGRNVQTGAMDVLLRLLRDLPGSLAYLKNLAA
jgi:putative zinc finger/helix-turn-helix YgiT family protein